MNHNTSQVEQQSNGDNDGNDDGQSEGVVIPEEFQKKVHAVVHGASKAHLNHISDRVSEARDAIRMKEQAAMSKGKKNFTTEGGPVDPMGM